MVIFITVLLANSIVVLLAIRVILSMLVRLQLVRSGFFVLVRLLVFCM